MMWMCFCFSSQEVKSLTLALPSSDGAPLLAYQYFENVRNFLVAVQELNLPTFEASDLEKVRVATSE
jgi:kinesin family protein C2/C3